MTHPSSAALPLPRLPRLLAHLAAPRPSWRVSVAEARAALAAVRSGRRPLDVVVNEALRAAFLGLGLAWAAAEIALAVQGL